MRVLEYSPSPRKVSDMRRQFFVHYADFNNTYDLMYADTQDNLDMLPAGAERITRKKAESLCAEENRRRRYEGSFGGYADNAIYPVGMTDDEKMNVVNVGRYRKRRYIWERRTK